MTLIRRRFLQLAATVAAAPFGIDSLSAQPTQGGPKLTQILRKDLQGQDERVQETVVNVLEMAPGAAAPWHMHPAAQEILFVIEGSVTVEIEGHGSQERRDRLDSRRDSPSCAQRRQRRRESPGDPQPRRQGKAVRRRRQKGELEHFPEKWIPVFRRKCDHVKESRARSDSIQSERALGAGRPPRSAGRKVCVNRLETGAHLQSCP